MRTQSQSQSHSHSHSHTTPDDTLVATLNALAAAAAAATNQASLIVATDDGDVVYGRNAWTPRQVRGLVPVILHLTHAHADANETPAPQAAHSSDGHLRAASSEAIEAAVWELGMERSHALLDDASEEPDSRPDLHDVAIMTTASDVQLLVQYVLALDSGRAPTQHLRGLLEAVAGISLLDAEHGSTICVVYLAAVGGAGDATLASARAEHEEQAAVLRAVRIWMTATEQTPEVQAQPTELP